MTDFLLNAFAISYKIVVAKNTYFPDSEENYSKDFHDFEKNDENVCNDETSEVTSENTDDAYNESKYDFNFCDFSVNQPKVTKTFFNY